MSTELPITQIRTDGGTQPRAALHPDWVLEYAQDMQAGATFPPVTVFHDGRDYWLADGFHRLRAADAAGKREIVADVRQGTRRDAVLHSVGANAAHGMRRTNEDKRRAVLTLLNDPEWCGWADREIARRCGVHHETVGNLRPKPPPQPVSGGFRQIAEPRTVGRGGGTYPMNTAGINAGRLRPGLAWTPADIPARPQAPPPEPPKPDPEKQAAFRLVSSFGGRLRDFAPLLDVSPSVVAAALAGQWGSSDDIAQAKRLHAWLQELIQHVESTYDHAA